MNIVIYALVYFLKIDAQGSEWEVRKGAVKKLG